MPPSALVPERIGAFGWLVRASNTLASLWILVLMLLMLADVALRFAFNRPVTGVNEILEISIVAMLYMQIAQALRDDKHTRSDAYRLRLQRRNPRAALLLDAVFMAAGFALMVFILAATWPRVMEAWQGGFTIGNRGVFIVPEWPLRAVILFGCLLMAVQFATLSVSRARRFVGGGPAATPPADRDAEPPLY